MCSLMRLHILLIYKYPALLSKGCVLATSPRPIIAKQFFSPRSQVVWFFLWWCNDKAGIVEEGVALEPLPWEAKGLDGLELP
jgi:hypothetical protein